MGRYEPPRKTQAREPRKISGRAIVAGLSGLVTTISAAAAFSFVDIESIQNLEQRLRPREAITRQYVAPHNEIHAPMIEATMIAQGTMPIADGNYVQLSTVSSERTAEVLNTLAAAGMKPIKESLGKQDRLLMHYAEGEQHEIVKKFSAVYPTATPLLMKKEGGKDHFFKYEAPKVYTPTEINSMLEAAAHKYRVPPDVLKAVAHQENRWAEKSAEDLEEALFAIGDKGKSFGLMQIYTVKHPEYNVQRGLEDPSYNIEYGARFLRGLFNETGSWEKAIERYNGSGPKAQKYRRSALKFMHQKPWTRIDHSHEQR